MHSPKRCSGLTIAHLLTALCIIAVIKRFITGSLPNNSKSLDPAAVKNTRKSCFTHPAGNTTQSHLMIAIIDIITAPKTLTASVSQADISKGRRSIPTAAMSNIGITILTIGAGTRTTGSAIAAETDLAMIRPTGHPRLQTMPSSQWAIST